MSPWPDSGSWRKGNATFADRFLDGTGHLARLWGLGGMDGRKEYALITRLVGERMHIREKRHMRELNCLSTLTRFEEKTLCMVKLGTPDSHIHRVTYRVAMY